MGLTTKFDATFYSLDAFAALIQSLTGMYVGGTNAGTAISGATPYFKIISSYQSDMHQTTQFFYTLESTSAVDSYLTTDATQTYRLVFTATVTNDSASYGTGQPDANNDYTINRNLVTGLTLSIGTPGQIYIPSSASSPASAYPTILPGTPTFTLWSGLPASTTVSANVGFVSTLTSRGIAISTYRTADTNTMPGTGSPTTANSTIVVQRPVNPSDGTIKVQGTAPIFALGKSCDATTSGFQFSIIREKDISAPTALVDTSSVSNTVFYKFSTEWPHPNLFDDMTHVIKFPFGFCSTRHLYMEEMDLLCIVNATAFITGQDMSITMYGETSARAYTTTYGDLVYGGLSLVNGILTPVTEIKGGARIGILTAGGGI